MRYEDLIRALDGVDYIDGGDFEKERKSFLDAMKPTMHSEPKCCKDCLLFEYDAYYSGRGECSHPMSNGYQISSSELNIIPAWCKLRTSNIMIRIKGE